MYRKSMEEENRINQEEFVSRLGNLPVVNSAWTQACTLYQKTKDSNAVFRTALNMAEGTVKTFTETSKPYIEKYQPQIERVNEYAYQQLVRLEENYPVITKPTNELLSNGKELCGSIVKPAVDRVNAVKQYGTDKYNGVINGGKEKVNQVKQLGTNTINTVKDLGMATVNKTLETSYGQYVVEKMDDVLTMSEDYLDKYLPDSEEEAEGTEMDNLSKEGVMDEFSVQNPVTRVSHLTTKVRRRMYKRAVKDLKNVQMRSLESLAKLNFTVDLTLAVARQLTRQLRHGMDTVTGCLPDYAQPTAVYERLQEAKKYTEDLFQSFRDVKSYDEIPSWVLSQTKEKLSYLQETLHFVTETVIAAPLQFLTVDVDLNGISLEEPLMALDCNGHVPHLSDPETEHYVPAQ
ncbi:hypothetical protein KUTeg_018417 [Tegillarca granosa]|uniref:Perilipin-2 n=1 Tax=Tegillarca granosa TaxID=220873 RepID=A0ABQ9EHQ3_TEGGR|nr:hypothetical protein KUTeg_018417 [Tegillarca granosa]